MPKSLLVPAALVILLTGCADLNGPDSRALHGRWTADRVALENRTGSTVYYMAVGRIAAVSINWAPTVGPGAQQVARGETLRFTTERILFVRPESEDILVYWWHAVPDGKGGHRHGQIRTLGISRPD